MTIIPISSAPFGASLSRLGAHTEGLGRAGDLPSRWAENHGETAAKTMTFCWVKGDKHGG